MQLTNKQPINTAKLAGLSLLLACGYFFGALMYTPSLPAITDYFDASSSLSRMTISSFLFVLGISQLIYGPASDKYGRKPFILFGALMFLVGSLVATFSPNIYVLILARAIQGAGAGALLVLARSIMQDTLPKDKFLQVVAWLSIFFSMAPAISPLLGGFLQTHFGWHGNFAFMSLFALILVGVITVFLPETHFCRNPHALNIKHLFVNYWEVSRNSRFLVYSLFVVVSLSGPVIFDAIGSFVIINDYGFSALDFGIISTLLLGVIILSRIISSVILMRLMKTDQIVLMGLSLMLGAVTILFAINLWVHVSFDMLFVLMAIFYLGSGFVLPISSASALTLFNKNKGVVNALFGALQMGGVFLSSFIAALILPTLPHMVNLLLIMSIISFVVGIIYLPNKKRIVAV